MMINSVVSVALSSSSTIIRVSSLEISSFAALDSATSVSRLGRVFAASFTASDSTRLTSLFSESWFFPPSPPRHRTWHRHRSPPQHRTPHQHRTCLVNLPVSASTSVLRLSIGLVRHRRCQGLVPLDSTRELNRRLHRVVLQQVVEQSSR